MEKQLLQFLLWMENMQRKLKSRFLKRNISLHYDHHDAEGFINLFGLSSKVRAMKMMEIEKNK